MNRAGMSLAHAEPDENILFWRFSATSSIHKEQHVRGTKGVPVLYWLQQYRPTRRDMKTTRFLAGMITSVLIVFASASAIAAPISLVEETIEAMIDAQTANVTYLLRAHGNANPPDFNLSFSTIVDSSNRTFNVSSNPGSVLNGTELGLDISGSFNNQSGMWEMNSTGNFGTTPFLGTGNMIFDLSPQDPIIKAGAKGEWLWGLLDYRSTVKLLPQGNRSQGDIIFTIAGNDVGSVSVSDVQLPRDNPTDPIKYMWTIDRWNLAAVTPESPGVAPNRPIFASGAIDLLTGQGSLQASLPEPSSLALLGISIALLFQSQRQGFALPQPAAPT